MTQTGGEEEDRFQEARRKMDSSRFFPEGTYCLRVISDAGEKLEKCVYSYGEFLEKSAGMPIFQRPGKLEATIISNSSERERVPQQKNMDHSAEKRCVSEFQDGPVHKPISVKESG